ncbi:TetR/AcrR family transcriptional regulator [SAR202 cluster bacterium AC-409-J13_OGT_754m]|nr:TetR/AcrR family transcriptional regulator [SAR202 cluster bacterium AC-409-J13_OGT_754m]
MITAGRQRHYIRQIQILAAVRRIVSNYGLQRLTIHDIAREIGVTEGAIYRHFRSKREILNYVVEAWKETLMGALPDIGFDHISPIDDLRNTFLEQLSDVEEYRGLAFAVVAESMIMHGAGVGDQIAQVIREYMDRIKSILQRGVVDGSIRSDLDIETASIMFLGMVQTTARLWSLGHFRDGISKHANSAWDLYMTGISSPNDSSMKNMIPNMLIQEQNKAKNLSK